MRSLVTQFLLMLIVLLLGALCVRLYYFDEGYDASAIRSITPIVQDANPAAKQMVMDELSTREIVRQVMREELASFQDDIVLAVKTELSIEAEARTATVPTVSNPPPNTELKAEVDRDLYSMISQGSATPSEMAALQSKIAQLPAEQRSEALSEISRAMNEGRLAASF